MTSIPALDLHTDHDATSPSAQERVHASVLDADNAAIETWVNTLRSKLALVIRDDDTLVDKLVRLRNLHPEVAILLATGATVLEEVFCSSPVGANVALTGSTSGFAIDGIAASVINASANKRVLLWQQSNPSYDGIYVYSENAGTYTLSRSSDSITAGCLVSSANGVSNGGMLFMAPSTVSARWTSLWRLNGDASYLDVLANGSSTVRSLRDHVPSDALNPVVRASTLSSARSNLGISSAMDPVVTASTLAAARAAMDPGQGDWLVKATGSTTAISESNRAKYGFNVYNYGATGDGVANDRSAIDLANTAAGATGEITFYPGTYLVSTSITISCGIRMMPGAVLSIPSGCVITINGKISAGTSKIFDVSGGGSVVINSTSTPSGYAEWWGAVKDNAAYAASNTDAINAALAALMVTFLLPGEYFVDDTIFMTLSYRAMIGAGSRYNGVNSDVVTRIILTNGTGHVVQVGPLSNPGSVNDFNKENIVRDVCIGRSVAPVVTSGCDGLRMQYVLYAMCRNVKSMESVYPFEYYGTVHTKMDDCHAFRSLAGTGGADICHGHYVNGNASIGLNGGNASLYLNRCLSEIGGISISNSNGFYLDGAFTDCFINQPETSGFSVGISIAGNGSNTTLNHTNLDLQITNPILDTFTANGIYITNANKYGSIEIIGGYYGAASGATAAIHVNASYGSVNVVGGQLLMGVSATSYGVRVASSNGVRVSGTQILEAGAAAVVIDDADNCHLSPIVKNHSTVCPVAVQLFNTCEANVISPQVMGGANKVSLGIQVVGTSDGRNEYMMSGVDSSCINGGSANKLTRNGVQITATGLSGTNLVSGVMT